MRIRILEKMKRDGRLAAIRRLVGASSLRSQEDLLVALRREGFAVTQATLSRDLKVLGVVRVPGSEGEYVYSFSDPEGKSGSGQSLTGDFMRGFISMEFSGAFALIKTLPGHASSVAYALDHLRLDSVLGTVAGDDTVLVVPRDGATKSEILREIRQRIPGIPC
jgi:transcriptional regulator of arginine metabolism